MAAQDRENQTPGSDETGTPGAHTPPDWASSLMVSPSDCIRMRLLALLVIRLVGFGFLAATLVPIISWITEGIRDSDLLDMYYYGARIITAFVLGAIGVVLVVAAGPISRRMFVIPREPRCPDCRFSLQGLTEPKCPECGLCFFPGEKRSPSRHTASQHRAWLIATVAVLRIIAVLLIVSAFGNLLQWLWWLADDWGVLFYPFLGLRESLQFVLAVASAVLPGALLWLLAPKIGAMCLQAGLKPEVEPDEAVQGTVLSSGQPPSSDETPGV